MLIFYAGAESFKKTLSENKVDTLLFSYFFLKKNEVDWIKDVKNTILDSGAFSAFSQKKEIDIYEYIKFLKEKGDNFKAYANLDVIGSAEKTLENQKIMEEAGLKPVPCFHYKEDLQYLKDYAEKYDYIALGGLVPYSKDKPKLYAWLDKCFAILMPYILSKKLKVHGFGVGSDDILKKYPFYSADASSWLAGGKFGRMIKWNSQTLKMKGDFHYSDINSYLEGGANLNATEHYDNRNMHNIRQYQLMEEDLTKLWKARGIYWES